MDPFPKISHQQEQLVRIDRRFLELKVLIKTTGRVVNRMNHHRADVDDISCFFDAGERIEQQRFPQASALLSLIHGEPSRQHDADRMVGQALEDPLRTLVLVY